MLPLIPGYLSAISAVEIDRLGDRGVGRRIAVASVPFIVGFTIVFVLLGAGAAAVGSAVDKPTQLKIAGFVLIVLGLAFMGLLPWPERAVAPGLLQHARRRGSKALLGGAFAVCAAPCIGTVLASILVLASGSGSIARGVVLLVAYSLGLGAAFVLAGIAFAHAMTAFGWVRDHYGVIRFCVGRDTRRSRSPALLQPELVAPDRARPGADEDRARLALARRAARPRPAAVRGREGREPPQRLDALALGCNRLAAAALIGRDDDMHQPLEEVALLFCARAPRDLERFVGIEVGTGAREPQALLVGRRRRC